MDANIKRTMEVNSMKEIVALDRICESMGYTPKFAVRAQEEERQQYQRREQALMEQLRQHGITPAVA
jgi:hypothetical protein